jgi:outer membrane immunogenic protein
MKTLMSAAAGRPVGRRHPRPVPRPGTGVYGTLGYAGSRADGADTGAVQGRLGAKLTPHFGVEGELSGGVKDDDIDTNGVRSNIEQTHSAAVYGVGFLPVTPTST